MEEDNLIEPNFSENALTVLRKRYLRKDEKGNIIETPKQMLIRVAEDIAKAELNYNESEFDKWKHRFYNIMASLDFLPNTPCLINAGTERQMLSACFVLPVEDSIDGIFDALKWQAKIHQAGGGTGFSFSDIRPEGDIVRKTGGISSGPISFMRIFNSATETIKQGNTRRGANMGILHISHPDVWKFIHLKQDLTEMENFNVSVAVTDDFMKIVERHQDKLCEGCWDLINPRSKEKVRKVCAKKYWNAIVKCAWNTGDPGLFFIDKANSTNPVNSIEEIKSTNPCGEVPLSAFDSCNLGSINLSNFVVNGKLNRERLSQTVQYGVRFLDNVIDRNLYPIPEIREKKI